MARSGSSEIIASVDIGTSKIVALIAEINGDNVLARILQHKEAIISHLSWVSLFLGFHTLGLYIHNDVCVAFGTPEKQIVRMKTEILLFSKPLIILGNDD